MDDSKSTPCRQPIGIHVVGDVKNLRVQRGKIISPTGVLIEDRNGVGPQDIHLSDVDIEHPDDKPPPVSRQRSFPQKAIKWMSDLSVQIIVGLVSSIVVALFGYFYLKS